MLRIQSSIAILRASSRFVGQRQVPSSSFHFGRLSFSDVKGAEATNDSTTTNNNESSKAADSHSELIAKMEKDLKDLREKVIRSYAEEENVRRIAKRGTSCTN
jgi:molecular chaperone GrpE (heat shock protein)